MLAWVARDIRNVVKSTAGRGAGSLRGPLRGGAPRTFFGRGRAGALGLARFGLGRIAPLAIGGEVPAIRDGEGLFFSSVISLAFGR